MATYKETVGTSVANISGNSGVVDGQLWYDTSSSAFKYQYLGAGAWASGGNLNTGRESASSQNIGSAPHVALAAGNGGPPASGITELYNGSAWTEVNNLNTVRYGAAGSGTTTAGLAFGGENYPSASPPYQAATETWNGTCWAEVADLNTARYATCGGGTKTSALCAGGEFPGYATTPVAETWNGTCWAEVANPGQARRFSGAAVVDNTSGLIFGGLNPGQSPSIYALTELWNGSAWTEVADLTTARYGSGGTGTVTAALAFGGDTPPNTGKTEEYNGTSWTETTDMSTATKFMFGSGTTASALAAGGSPALTRTEEWTNPVLVSKTLTE
tara:strand:- start:1293 stop:2282 length:990 start_codon:yes stop_codon:yes gene_type:complete